MTKCEECGKEAKMGSITGKDKTTGKPTTLCWPCFNEKYELKRPAKTNIFIKKKGGK